MENHLQITQSDGWLPRKSWDLLLYICFWTNYSHLFLQGQDSLRHLQPHTGVQGNLSCLQICGGGFFHWCLFVKPHSHPVLWNRRSEVLWFTWSVDPRPLFSGKTLGLRVKVTPLHIWLYLNSCALSTCVRACSIERFLEGVCECQWVRRTETLMWSSKMSGLLRNTIKHKWQEQMGFFIVPWNANSEYLHLMHGTIIYLFSPFVPPLPANSVGTSPPLRLDCLGNRWC